MKTFVLFSFMALVISNAYSYVHYHYPTKIIGIELLITSIPPKNTTSEDGKISIFIKGGTPPYTTLITGTTFPAETFYKDQILLSNLSEGSFSIIVQDQSKKIVYKSIEIKAQQ